MFICRIKIYSYKLKHTFLYFAWKRNHSKRSLKNKKEETFCPILSVLLSPSKREPWRLKSGKGKATAIFWEFAFYRHKRSEFMNSICRKNKLQHFSWEYVTKTKKSIYNYYINFLTTLSMQRFIFLLFVWFFKCQPLVDFETSFLPNQHTNGPGHRKVTLHINISQKWLLSFMIIFTLN